MLLHTPSSVGAWALKRKMSPGALTPDYLRPLERPVHIGSSTNTWGPLKPSQMWNFDVVQARLKLNSFCQQLPGKQCSLGQRVSGQVIAPVCYYRRLLSPTSDTHIGLLSPPFSASATSWRLLGHQQAQFEIPRPVLAVKTLLGPQPRVKRLLVRRSRSTLATANGED